MTSKSPRPSVHDWARLFKEPQAHQHRLTQAIAQSSGAAPSNRKPTASDWARLFKPPRSAIAKKSAPKAKMMKPSSNDWARVFGAVKA